MYVTFKKYYQKFKNCTNYSIIINISVKFEHNSPISLKDIYFLFTFDSYVNSRFAIYLQI